MKKHRALLQIVLAGLLWGTSGLFVHAIAPYGFSSLQITAVRGSSSFLLIFAFVLLCDRSLLRVSGKQLLFFAANGLTLFVTAASYYISMQRTSVSTAVMLMYISPVLIMIFSVVLLGERFTRTKLLAMICVMVGCVFVSGIIGGFAVDTVGILVGVLSGVSYAIYNILIKIELSNGTRPLSATVYGFLFMALFAICLSRPAEIPALLTQRPVFLPFFALCFAFCTFVLPYFLYTISLKELPAGTASALSIIEPMAATVYSILFLDEKPTVLAFVGIVLVLSAVVLLSRTEEAPSEKTQ